MAGIRSLKRVLVAFLFVSLSIASRLSAEKASVCINCHKEISPGIVRQFFEGKMAISNVDCSTCHGIEHDKADNVMLAKMPSPEICESCHNEQVKQFKSGKHNLAWAALNTIPMALHQSGDYINPGKKGCMECHRIGDKTRNERNDFRYGNCQCNLCHTRHTFKKAEAQDPRACQTCHMGFDHPQWEMWSTSKHGTIWQIEGKESKRAPVCQTCHMPSGSHKVITAWGFLALRLPMDEGEWKLYRTNILTALGILDIRVPITERYENIKKLNMLRMEKKDFQEERNKMVEICSKCHGTSYSVKQLEDVDMLIKSTDKLMDAAINEVKDLYAHDLLIKPDGWISAPDLLQFYEGKSSIEQDLFRMFFEYRMRTFQGAFHMNPDYMHWYGWAPMKGILQRIKDEANRIRAIDAVDKR